MTTSGLGIIPLFSENAKFNGTNWPTWKEAVRGTLGEAPSHTAV